MTVVEQAIASELANSRRARRDQVTYGWSWTTGMGSPSGTCSGDSK
jgi:hypothetical protein